MERQRLEAAVERVGDAECGETTVSARGNLPTPEQLTQIKPGVTDKASVTALLGSPSSIASFDDATWYYISQKSQELAFFQPEVRDPEVVAVVFDKDGIVKDV